ncbi:hypothetical protein M408DRAFT_234379 [Serendipita vermifera MAFF 305830]|uniref:Uncharacterized protein n=1 Tax=Serendipita vermifera MAFF 305830 TaxID=933852 RepID=A0A0C2X4N3_SERVB|nr:hypothetical protein M408DRAFT_234379 [Serendipita vermifera MAFF 305830]
MYQTGSIISGSSALWLICGFPKEWSAGDLDVYCCNGQGHILVNFFQTQGYQVVNYRTEATEDESSSFFDNSGLSAATKLKRDNREVDILESPTKSAFTPLTCFHSSIVMNYITSSEIVVAYPTFTLRNIGIVQTGTPQRGNQWKEKYETQRAFSIWRHHPMDTSRVCPKRLRWIGDGQSLIVAFDEPAALAPDQNTSWRFNGTQYHQLCSPAVCTRVGFDRYAPRTWDEFIARTKLIVPCE